MDAAGVFGVDDDPAETPVGTDLVRHLEGFVGGAGVGFAVQIDVAASVGDEHQQRTQTGVLEQQGPDDLAGRHEPSRQRSATADGKLGQAALGDLHRGGHRDEHLGPVAAETDEADPVTLDVGVEQQGEDGPLGGGHPAP